MADVTVEGIISVAMTVVIVIAGAYLVSTLFVSSGEDKAVMAMRDIASYTNKADKSDDGDCYSFRMKISPGFRINKLDNLIMVETPGKIGESALKDLEMKHELIIPDSYDSDDDFNNPGDSFPINEDFSDTINEDVCICNDGGNNILFIQPTVLGIADYCSSVFEIVGDAADYTYDTTVKIVT